MARTCHPLRSALGHFLWLAAAAAAVGMAWLSWNVSRPEQHPPAAARPPTEPSPAAEFAALPRHDFLSEARLLLDREEFDEARAICRMQLAYSDGDAAERRLFRDLLADADRLEASWQRRGRQVAAGVLTGQADNLPGLAGAVVSDFFVVGDIRDLAIQGYRWSRHETVNKPVLLLSAIGLATTVVPNSDWLPGLFKRAIQSGKLAPQFVERAARQLLRAGHARRAKIAEEMVTDAMRIRRQWGSGGLYSALQHLDDVGDLSRMARVSETYGDCGIVALRLGRRELAAAIKTGTDLGHGADLARAAMRGPRGVKLYLKHGAAIFRPHLLVGVAKTVARPERHAPIARWAAPHLARLSGLAAVPPWAWLTVGLGLAAIRLSRIRSALAPAAARRGAVP